MSVSQSIKQCQSVNESINVSQSLYPSTDHCQAINNCQSITHCKSINQSLPTNQSLPVDQSINVNQSFLMFCRHMSPSGRCGCQINATGTATSTSDAAARNFTADFSTSSEVSIWFKRIIFRYKIHRKELGAA